MSQIARIRRNGKKFLLITEDANLSHPDGPKGAVFEVDPITNRVRDPRRPLFEKEADSNNDKAWLWSELNNFVQRVDNPPADEET